MRAAAAAIALLGGLAVCPASAADASACDAVIATLTALERAVPTLRGDGDMFASGMMVRLSRRAEVAATDAAAAGWSAEARGALAGIVMNAHRLSGGGTPFTPATAEQMTAIAAPIVAEAQAVCAGATIPLATN